MTQNSSFSVSDSALAPGSLRHHFLVAMPGLADPSFVKTVTYVCEHTEKGAMGIIINVATPMPLGEVFAQMALDGPLQDTERLVLAGGPVQRERGFVLHSPDVEFASTLKVSDGVSLTASRDIIEAIAKGQGPSRYMVALGYAGWNQGQLEQEIAQNSWLTVPADADLIFDVPASERWLRAGGALGINMGLMPMTAGHA